MMMMVGYWVRRDSAVDNEDINGKLDLLLSLMEGI